MSEEISKVKNQLPKNSYNTVTWGPWGAVIIVLVAFIGAQLVAAEMLAVYPALRHWTHQRTDIWINNSVIAQFFYVLIAEALTVAVLALFIKRKKGSWQAIGLKKPKLFTDIAWAFIGLLVYFPTYIFIISILSALIKGLNINQQQALGFSQSTNGWQLFLVFISLVMLPPIVEEIVFRGFLFSGLKKKLPLVWAILITSLIFAAPHLLESTSGGALWIAGIDTFILSIVLCWLRQKTDRLYAGMGLHGLKNFVAFLSIFLLHLH